MTLFDGARGGVNGFCREARGHVYIEVVRDGGARVPLCLAGGAFHQFKLFAAKRAK